MSNEFEQLIELNNEITNASRKYILQNNTCSLIHPEESPNANIIYHLYNDGEITSQKGGWAYLQRSVFTSASPVIYDDAIKRYFTFNYVVLPYEECKEFRERMNCLNKQF
jgi:hypothetical protein